MVLHCLLENDCKRSQLSSSSVSLFVKLRASNFTSSIVISIAQDDCSLFTVPPVLYMTISSNRFTFTLLHTTRIKHQCFQSDCLLSLLFFIFIAERAFSTATFYEQEFLKALKNVFVPNSYFIFFVPNLISVLNHYDLVTHIHSQSIVTECQEQIAYTNLNLKK